MELTEAARPLYDQVAAACEMLMAAQEAFMRSSHAQELEIRMSFTEIFTYFFPISYLREFQASHPKIRVCLSNHGTSKAVSMPVSYTHLDVYKRQIEKQIRKAETEQHLPSKALEFLVVRWAVAVSLGIGFHEIPSSFCVP